MNTDSPESLAPDAEREMLEALLDGDGKSWTRLLSGLPDDRALRLLSVATSVMIFRKWPNDPSLAEIASYVAEIVGRFPGELPVPPVVVESVIRGILTEPEIIDEISLRDIGVAETFIIASVRDDVLHSAKDRSEYISEVLEAAG